MVVSRYVAVIHEKRRALRDLYGTNEVAKTWQLISEIKEAVAKLEDDNRCRDDIDKLLESRCL